MERHSRQSGCVCGRCWLRRHTDSVRGTFRNHCNFRRLTRVTQDSGHGARVHTGGSRHVGHRRGREVSMEEAVEGGGPAGRYILWCKHRCLRQDRGERKDRGQDDRYHIPQCRSEIYEL